MSPKTLSLAVCVFPEVCPTDYQGPVELLSFISPGTIARGLFPHTPAVTIEATYVGTTLEPLIPGSGPRILADKTYDDVKDGEQFDIILVPGGLGTRPGVLPQVLLDFLRKQAPGAKYVLSVCTGAEVLARAGVLDGLRATTNKSQFSRIQASNYGPITWIPKARWVVDDNDRVWTSSGVTAGTDMAFSFLVFLVGKELAEVVRGIVELGIHAREDDEFAEFYGLV